MFKFTTHLRLGLTLGAVFATSAVHALFFQPHQAGSGNGINDDVYWQFQTGSGIYWFGNQVTGLIASSNAALSDDFIQDHNANIWDQNQHNIMAVGFTHLHTPGNQNPWLDVASDTNDLALTWDLPSAGGGGMEFSQLAIIRTSGIFTAEGVPLLQGDVVMSFDLLPSTNSSALAVGISDANGNDTLAPGEPTEGIYNSPFHFGSEIPIGSGQLVFRWDSNTGQYDYLPTPEPTTFALLGFGALALIRRSKKRSV